MQPSTRPKVSIDFLQLLFRYAEINRKEQQHLLKQVGISIEDPILEPSFIRADLYNDIWDKVVEFTQDECFGLHFGEKVFHYMDGHILYIMLKNCPDIQTAITKLIQYHNIMTNVIGFNILNKGLDTTIQLTTPFKELAIHSQYIDSIFSILMTLIRHLSMQKIKAKSVHYVNKQPCAIEEYARILGCIPNFNSDCYQLTLNRSFLDIPIFMANTELLTSLEQFASQKLNQAYPPSDLKTQTMHWIKDRLLNGLKVDIQKASHYFNTSERNFQLKLNQEGVSYQALYNDVRKQMALDYLKSKGQNAIMSDLAFILGFSDQSAFNHAFKRWMGITPTQWLQEHKSLEE